MRRSFVILLALLLIGWTMFGCGSSRRSSKSTVVSEKPAESVANYLPAALPDSLLTSITDDIDDEPSEDNMSDLPTDTLHVAQTTIEEEEIPFEDEVLPEDEVAFGDDLPFEDEIGQDQVLEWDEDETEEGDITPAVDSLSQPPVLLTPDQEAEQIADSLFVYGDQEEELPYPETSNNEEGSKIVDFRGDVMRNINLGADSSAVTLVGNVVFYHNGAVITCDSAVRYSPTRMELFKRVVINKGTTYVYGDRADYDGNINMAWVYAPIIKMVDEDAVLYTYRFSFNTLDNIGRYGGGGTLSQQDNLMESKRGYYFVDNREIIGVDSVQVRNPDYRLRGDSVAYNLDTETATFFTKSYIWNNNDEILTADRGRYLSQTSDYRFTRNSYIVTPNKEIWADTLYYNSESGDAVAYRDIQYIDDEQHLMAFADYGEYWGEADNAMMTLDPSLVSFDPEQPDTLYVRADSMFMYTFDRTVQFKTTNRGGEPDLIPSFGEEEELEIEITDESDDLIEISANEHTTDSLAAGSLSPITELSDSLGYEEIILPDHLREEALASDDEIEISGPEEDIGQFSDQQSPLQPVPDKRTSKQQERERRQAEKEERRNAKSQERQERREEIRSIIEGTHEHDHDHEHDEDLAHDVIHREIKEALAAAEESFGDSIAAQSLSGLDSLGSGPEVRMPQGILHFTELEDEDGYFIMADSIGQLFMFDPPETYISVDSAGTPMGRVIIPFVEQPVLTREDTIQRVFYGYPNVRIFRDDFQAVCDSLVGFSIDSTLHMYVNPVLWTEENQILSDIIDIYTRDEQLYKAEFFGSPFATSQVDSTRFNQVRGRFMEAWFENNEIYKHDVVGNAESYYYMEDDETGDIMTFTVIESADLSFLFEEQQLTHIVWRTNPVYTIYPIDKIPASQSELFPDFKWEEERRPKSKYDILSRTVRPSEREFHFSLPQPTFPLSERILRHRDSMIQRGIWRERNDVLSEETREYVRKIESGEGPL